MTNPLDATGRVSPPMPDSPPPAAAPTSYLENFSMSSMSSPNHPGDVAPHPRPTLGTSPGYSTWQNRAWITFLNFFSFLPFRCCQAAKQLNALHSEAARVSLPVVATVRGHETEEGARAFLEETKEARLAQRDDLGGDWISPIQITEQSSLAAVQAAIADPAKGKVGVLSFANRKTPGGSGATPFGGSQEESLIRGTNLGYSFLPSLTSHLEEDRITHLRARLEGAGVNPDTHCIPQFGALISEDVRIFNTQTRSYEAPKRTFCVISSAAQDCRVEEYIEATTLLKIQTLLAAAVEARINHLILGGYGCGVFENSPDNIALLFQECLTIPVENGGFAGCFQTVEFAIPNFGREDVEKIQAFRKILAPAEVELPPEEAEGSLPELETSGEEI